MFSDIALLLSDHITYFIWSVNIRENSENWSDDKYKSVFFLRDRYKNVFQNWSVLEINFRQFNWA